MSDGKSVRSVSNGRRLLCVPATAMFILLLGMTSVRAEGENGVIGRWLTESGKGIVEFYSCGGEICGRVSWLKDLIRDGASAKDAKNSDPKLQGRPLCGLVILGGFKETEPNHWIDGWIYSPENGKTYDASMRIDGDGKLKLRGYIGISLLGETQTWTRADLKSASC